ncbi:MAG: hypothetical protein DME74_00115 [Verrucomicrobia bacterium]|nr:MAG: hypothetical protein DME74_00115 [Verrucomicrobiota bacterium]
MKPEQGQHDTGNSAGHTDQITGRPLRRRYFVRISTLNVARGALSCMRILSGTQPSGVLRIGNQIDAATIFTRPDFVIGHRTKIIISLR